MITTSKWWLHKSLFYKLFLSEASSCAQSSCRRCLMATASHLPLASCGVWMKQVTSVTTCPNLSQPRWVVRHGSLTSHAELVVGWDQHSYLHHQPASYRVLGGSVRMAPWKHRCHMAIGWGAGRSEFQWHIWDPPNGPLVPCNQLLTQAPWVLVGAPLGPIEQCFSTFLIPWPFSTVPRVVVIPSQP